MRFQVPQFIEVEDKIFGQLTFKQFIYVAGGVGFSVILFIFLPKFLAIIISLPVILFSAALAFYEANDKPFINLVEAFIKYTFTNKLYIWKKEDRKKDPRNKNQESTESIEQIHVPKLSESKLKELTWSLDIKESQNPVTNKNQESRIEN